MTKKQKAKDSRLQSTYGITFEEHARRQKHQKERCAICRKRIEDCASKKGLHTDHWHKLANTKVYCSRLKQSKLWKAHNAEFTQFGFHLPADKYVFKSKNKKKAKREVKKKLKRMANRGLLCYPCNSALRRFHNDPLKMKRAAKYINDYFKRIKKGNYDFSNT